MDTGEIWTALDPFLGSDTPSSPSILKARGWWRLYQTDQPIADRGDAESRRSPGQERKSGVRRRVRIRNHKMFRRRSRDISGHDLTGLSLSSPSSLLKHAFCGNCGFVIGRQQSKSCLVNRGFACPKIKQERNQVLGKKLKTVASRAALCEKRRSKNQDSIIA